MSSSLKTNLGKILNPFNKLKDGIYESIEVQKLAHSAIFKAYFGDSTDGSDNSDNFFIKYVKVCFCDKPEWNIEIDYRKHGIIFWIQTPRGNSEEVKIIQVKLSGEISMEYSTRINDSLQNRMDSIYLSLKKEARTKLIDEERKRLKEKR